MSKPESAEGAESAEKKIRRGDAEALRRNTMSKPESAEGAESAEKKIHRETRRR